MQIKPIQLFFLFTLLTVLAFSCTPEKNKPVNNSASDFSMTAKIDGIPWAASSFARAYNLDSSIIIEGKSTDGSEIKLFIADRFSGKKHLINGTTFNYAVYNIGDAQYSANLFVGFGLIEIKRDSAGILEGNFEFEGLGNETGNTSPSIKNISEGYFRLRR